MPYPDERPGPLKYVARTLDWAFWIVCGAVSMVLILISLLLIFMFVVGVGAWG